jgi:hypothetical protein
MDLRTWLVGLTLVMNAACGVSQLEGAESEDTSDDSQELSSTKDTFLITRRDYRRCVSPLCGGYWVKDLNSTMQERYVNAFDFSESSLPASARDAITGAPDNHLVLFGRLGKKESRFGTRPLMVKLAYRGMPGKTYSATDTFYGVFPSKIACITTPCANLQTTRLNRTTGHVMSTEIDLSAALATMVDDQWMMSRAYSGKTVIAGTIVRKGNHVTLTAKQVFVQLPDRAFGCPVERPGRCPSGQIHAYERSPDRCTIPTGNCTPPGACARFTPSCDPGYRQVSWTNICPRYACEAEFLEE